VPAKRFVTPRPMMIDIRIEINSKLLIWFIWFCTAIDF
jgi:hypothetical protein